MLSRSTDKLDMIEIGSPLAPSDPHVCLTWTLPLISREVMATDLYALIYMDFRDVSDSRPMSADDKNDRDTVYWEESEPA